MSFEYPKFGPKPFTDAEAEVYLEQHPSEVMPQERHQKILRALRFAHPKRLKNTKDMDIFSLDTPPWVPQEHL